MRRWWIMCGRASPTSPIGKWRCCWWLYLNPGPHTVRGLARVLNVSKPVVTRALNRLGSLGYLRRQRDETDKRNIFVARTSEGAEFLEEFGQFIDDAEQPASRRVSA